MPADFRILADDLTGALDTGVHLAGEAGAARTVSWRDGVLDDAFAYSTETRDAARSDAVAAAARAAGWLSGTLHPFKKVDSRLRGHPAQELAAVIDGASVDRVVIAPALPAEGRFVHRGRVVVRDEQGGQDMIEPTNLRCGLEEAGRPIKLFAAHEAHALEPAPRGISLWDCEDSADLDAVVTRALRAGGRTLWCGSSGLADALARVLGHRPVPSLRPTGQTLLLVGTNHPKAMAQADAFAQQHPRSCIEFTSDRSAAGADGPVQLALVAPRERTDPATAESCVLARLRWLVESLQPPVHAFVSGGATLLALADATGADRMELTGLYRAGAPVGRFTSGRWEAVHLITRSGGFGEPDYLLQLARGADVF